MYSLILAAAVDLAKFFDRNVQNNSIQYIEQIDQIDRCFTLQLSISAFGIIKVQGLLTAVCNQS